MEVDFFWGGGEEQSNNTQQNIVYQVVVFRDNFFVDKQHVRYDIMYVCDKYHHGTSNTVDNHLSMCIQLSSNIQCKRLLISYFFHDN